MGKKKKQITPSNFSLLAAKKKAYNEFIKELEEKGFNEGKEKQIKERMAHIGYHKFEGMYDRFSYLDAVVIEDSKE